MTKDFLEIKIRTDTDEKLLNMKVDTIEELPCVKCLMRPMCSNIPYNRSIECPILTEFIGKYSEGIEVFDIVSSTLQKQLLYIYNKINNRSQK